MRVSAVKGIFFVVLHSVTLRAENRAVTVHLLALPENQSTITLKGGAKNLYSAGASEVVL